MEEKKSGVCTFIATLIFSHIGLCFMVVIYCCIGGLIFEHLEKQNEIQICYDAKDEYDPMENKTITQLVDVMTQYEGTDDRSFMEIEIQTIIATFRNNSLAIGYNGDECWMYGKEGGPQFEWSWAGSMYFSVTVVSTIGKLYLSLNSRVNIPLACIDRDRV